MSTHKPETRNFPVTYSDGRVVIVKRLPVSKLEDVAALSQKIFERFFDFYNYSKNCLGDVLGDPACWGHINAIAAMLPIVGQDGPGLDVSLLGEDYEQIGQIFLTESVSLIDGQIEPPAEGQTLLPSKISALLGQNFFRVRAVQAIRAKEEQAITQDSSPLPATL